MARPASPGADSAYRWSVAARVIAGTLGTYGVTALITVALSFLLSRIGMAKVEAVTAATLASYALFAIIAIACFHARSALRAWIGLLVLAIPAGLLVLMLMPDVPQ